MRLPSGDQVGSLLHPIDADTWVTPVPSAFITKMSLIAPVPEMSLRVLANANLRPSGDHTGKALSYGPSVI